MHATKITFSHVKMEEQEFITVWIPGRDPLPASNTHPNFQIIRDSLRDLDSDAIVTEDQEQRIAGLFDVTEAVKVKLAVLSDRITARHGIIYLDGDPIHNSLTEQIIRFLEEDVDDWAPLVKFWENLLANPQEHSREQLYRWLASHRFTITAEGLIVGYKGVKTDDEHGYVSVHAGPGIYNGIEHEEGHLPNPVGGVIEMARSKVTHDPAVLCDVGLHVANGQYARHSMYGSNAVIEVHVNPRDVVSVPTDHGDGKMRVCRYTVIGESEADHEGALALSPDLAPEVVTEPEPTPEPSLDESFQDLSEDDEPDVEPEYCGQCGEEEDDCDCSDDEDEDRCWDCGEYFEDCTCDDEDDD